MPPRRASSNPGFSIHSGRTIALLCLSLVVPWLSGNLQAQSLPFMNAGPDSAFAQIDFAQLYLDTTTREQKMNAEQKEQRQHLVDIGAVSALDLNASDKALDEYNRAATLMKEQNTKQAIIHLRKAIAAYPKFVLAHNTLGLAYLDQQDGRARSEFETAAKLDDKFPGSFLHLGMFALAANDFATAESNLEKAASLSPKDPKILAALAFAQNGTHQYAQALETVRRVHTLEHRGMANVHYIAAAAAVALNDLGTVQRELTVFLNEDPTNPLAPVARQNLEVLARRQHGPVLASVTGPPTGATAATVSDSRPLQTFPNTERLEKELSAAGSEPENGACETCTPSADASTTAENPNPISRPELTAILPASVWTIRKTVDETALFFAVSSHGHMVSDLELSDIRIRDDNKPPERITQFIPQSKLPLRLGLLIDTSGSVQDRFSFEKRAAIKFVQKVLNGTSDLGFVAGFSAETTVTRDFVADPAELSKGIEGLKNGGGTSLFDAVSFSCRKLAEYPESGRVALVLVVLSDGEDNSSHHSLKQSIQDAETSGVTIYALSTRNDAGPKTDADKILEVLAERSGGEALFPGDMMTFEKSLDKLHDLIRSRYLLAYKPAGFEPNGKYRAIQMTAEKDGKRLHVYTRKGYYARLDAAHN